MLARLHLSQEEEEDANRAHPAQEHDQPTKARAHVLSTRHMRIRLDDGLKEPHEDGERNDAVIKPCPRVTQQHAPVCVRAEREVARVNEQHENGGRLDHGNQATVELVNEHGEVDDGRKQLPRLPSYRLGEAAATLTRAQPRSDTTSGLHGP